MALLAPEDVVASLQQQDLAAPGAAPDCERGSLSVQQSLGNREPNTKIQFARYLSFVGAFCAAALVGFFFVAPALAGPVSTNGHDHIAKNFVLSRPLPPLTKPLPTRVSSSARTASTNMVASESGAVASRREALTSGLKAGAGLLAAAALAPKSARADLAEVVARANAKAAEDRIKAASTSPEPVASTEDKVKPVLGAVGASVALSVPFFSQNLQRLGTKIGSGGKDSGYATKSKAKGKPTKGRANSKSTKGKANTKSTKGKANSKSTKGKANSKSTKGKADSKSKSWFR